MIDKVIGKDCTGCSSCYNICNSNAISMIPDSEGSYYPVVDYSKCKECKACVNRCPILSNIDNADYSYPKVYAAWNKDENVRINSTSGGIFSALAHSVISEGGIVVGAIYDENFEIKHVCIDNEGKINELRQSKYAQSIIGNIYRQVKDYLQNGKTVLFCGSPCQSAGLQNFLNKKYDNLYCCDFICRGVISQKVYQKYLKDLESIYDSKVSKVHFKNKDFGWNRFSTKISFENGKNYHQDRNHDYYMKGYLKHNLYLRPSCHVCHFKTLPRVSDLSLGDFWGIGNYKKELDCDKGTSVILINSQKGQKLFDSIKNNIVFEERTVENVIAGNSCLLETAKPGTYREYFFKKIDKQRFDLLIENIDRKANTIKKRDLLKEYCSVIKRKIRHAK